MSGSAPDYWVRRAYGLFLFLQSVCATGFSWREGRRVFGVGSLRAVQLPQRCSLLPGLPVRSSQACPSGNLQGKPAGSRRGGGFPGPETLVLGPVTVITTVTCLLLLRGHVIFHSLLRAALSTGLPGCFRLQEGSALSPALHGAFGHPGTSALERCPVHVHPVHLYSLPF